MRVKIRLQDVGVKRQRKYHIVIQPQRKKLQGLVLERVGQWLPRTLKTVPRQISLNTHRLKYWISVGAEPTKQVHRLISKYGMLPPLPAAYGSVHHVEKPEKDYHHTFFRGFGKAKSHQLKHGHREAFYYRQKLQEELNLVERRKRLNLELVANQGGDVTKAPSALRDDAEDTDGFESDDPDIFQRADKFKKILAKLEEHKEKNLLTYRGNDKRYNVYLRKLEKLSRKDLGLDILAYKDYVNNLKEFAHLNQDINVFAAEAMTTNSDPNSRKVFEVKFNQPDINVKLEGGERIEKNAESIIWTLKKLLRTGRSWISTRDRRAVKELDEHMRVYLVNNETILHNMRKVFVKFKKDEMINAKHFDAIRELKEDVSADVLRRARVSMREYKQIKLLIELNMNIFEEEGRIHTQHDLLPNNPMNHFVDFRNLPADTKLPKQAKEILYRPERMANLSEAYRRLVKEFQNDFLKKKHEKQAAREHRARRLNYADRIPQKPQEELDMIARLCKRIETDFQLSENEMVRVREHSVSAQAPIERYTNHLDWYKPLLTRLIEERRAMPKEERLKLYREDEVDQVDTTDLEQWSFKGMHFTREHRSLEEQAKDALKDPNYPWYQDPLTGEVKDQTYNPMERPDLETLSSEEEFALEAQDEMMSEAGEHALGRAEKVRKAAGSKKLGTKAEEAEEGEGAAEVDAATELDKFTVFGTADEVLVAYEIGKAAEAEARGEHVEYADVEAASEWENSDSQSDFDLHTKEHALDSIATREEGVTIEQLIDEDSTGPEDVDIPIQSDETNINDIRLSEKRLINQEGPTYEEIVDMLSDFKIVFDFKKATGKVGAKEIAIKKDFKSIRKNAQERKKPSVEVDAGDFFRRLQSYLGENFDTSMIPQAQKTDHELVRENMNIDHDKTLNSAMNQIRQMQQEWGLDRDEDLAWIQILADPGMEIDYANYQQPKEEPEYDIMRDFKGRYAGQTDAELSELEGPVFDNTKHRMKQFGPDEDVFFEVDTGKEYERLILRHRLDLAKLMFEKDGGYSLRHFKQIYLKEMRENPDKYILNSDSQEFAQKYSSIPEREPWEMSSLNYANYINRQKETYDLAAAVGLTQKSERANYTRNLILKAVESGALEAKVGSQFKKATPEMARLEEALATASELLRDERFKAKMQAQMNTPLKEVLETYDTYGIGGVQRTAMVRFCETLSDEDLQSIVIPFLKPAEVSELKALREKAGVSAEAAQEGEGEEEKPAEEPAAEDGDAEAEEGVVRHEDDFENATYNDLYQAKIELLEEQILGLGGEVPKEGEDLSEEHKKVLKDTNFFNMPKDSEEKQMIRHLINRQLSMEDFVTDKMTFKQKSDLYKANQFPDFLQAFFDEIIEDTFFDWESMDDETKQKYEMIGMTEETYKAKKAAAAQNQKEIDQGIIKEHVEAHNEEAKTNKKLMEITEEELQEILDKMYDHSEAWNVSDEEAAEAWFEEQFERIRTYKYKSKFPVQAKPDPTTEDPWDKLFEDKTQDYESVIPDTWWIDDEQKRKFHESWMERSCRYPQGFREYENYANYSLIHPRATIDEYMETMNKQIEFNQFLAIMSQHLRQEINTPEGMMKFKSHLNKVYGEVDYDSDQYPLSLKQELDLDNRDGGPLLDENQRMIAAVMTDVENFVKTDIFIDEMRTKYHQRVQGFLLNKEVYSLVECLEETTDYQTMGVDDWEVPVANTYVPVRNTIMKKPNLAAGADEDFGFRQGEYEKNRDQTIAKFGPLNQLSPIRGHRMAPGFPKFKKIPFDKEYRLKHYKWRRLSHGKQQDPSVSRSHALFSTFNRFDADAVSMPAKYRFPLIDESPFRQ